MNCKYKTDEERKEAMRQSLAKYRQSEKYKKSRRKYYDENIKTNEEKKKKMNEYCKEYNKTHKIREEIKEFRRKKANARYHNDTNYREKIKQAGKVYYEKNKEKVKEYDKKYYAEHKEQIAERKRQWRLRKLLEKKGE